MTSWERELLGDALIVGVAVILAAIGLLVGFLVADGLDVLWDPGFRVLA